MTGVDARPCSIDGCEGDTRANGAARGWCKKHYERWRRYGDPRYVPPIGRNAEHGTCARWRAGCRCEPCVQGHRAYAESRRRAKGVQPRRTAEHGTRSKYTGGCRCDECRIASRLAKKRMDAARHARLLADPTLAPHGTRSTYTNWLCRCEPCRAAWSVVMAERNAAKRERSAV